MLHFYVFVFSHKSMQIVVYFITKPDFSPLLPDLGWIEDSFFITTG